MLDLLKATSVLFGDCSKEPSSEDIYISGVKATNAQMVLITAKAEELQAVHESQAFARSRRAAYALLNQDEMRYDDLVNSTTTWQDAIAAIKQKHPR
jgi:sorbitol-specific phosphotransferase system component IIBC